MKKRYFKEFLLSPEGIATNILSDRLSKLERQGVITKEVDPENGRQVVYSLTDKGKGLIPVLVDLTFWGGVYDERSGELPGNLLDRIRVERDVVIEELAGDKCIFK